MTATTSLWLDLLGGEVAQRFYDAGGRRTRVLEAGQGPLLILLHGTGGHAEAYVRNLSAHAPYFRTMAIDMVGHGFTDKPEGLDYTIDDYADHVLAVMDAAGVKTAYISGESLGAMVAAWVAIRNPGRVEKIVLNTGTLARPDEEGQRELEDLRQRSLAVSSGPTREAVRKRMEWLVHDPASMTDELVEIRYRIYTQPGVALRIRRITLKVLDMVLGKAGEEYFDPARLGDIKCPVLSLWTPHNPGQNLSVARFAGERIADHRLHVVDDAAHWPQFEQPDEFNRVHLAFLRGLAPDATKPEEVR